MVKTVPTISDAINTLTIVRVRLSINEASGPAVRTDVGVFGAAANLIEMIPKSGYRFSGKIMLKQKTRTPV